MNPLVPRSIFPPLITTTFNFSKLLVCCINFIISITTIRLVLCKPHDRKIDNLPESLGTKFLCSCVQVQVELISGAIVVEHLLEAREVLLET